MVIGTMSYTRRTPRARRISLSLATELILNRLRNQKQIQRAEEDERRTEHEKQEHERSKLTVV